MLLECLLVLLLVALAMSDKEVVGLVASAGRHGLTVVNLGVIKRSEVD